MMVRFLLAVAVAATFAAGAAQARQAQAVEPPAAAVPAPAATATPPVAAEQSIVTGPGRPVVVQPMTSAPAAGSLIQTILALCAVLGLLAVLAWFMKRYGPKAIAGSAHVRLVGALNLGGRERIMVVEVGDQWIVVGASPGRVNALATMPRQAGVDAGTAAAANASLHPHQPPASSFAEWLKQTIDKRNAK
jgi:flagellar protein FliO/FliZ